MLLICEVYLMLDYLRDTIIATIVNLNKTHGLMSPQTHCEKQQSSSSVEILSDYAQKQGLDEVEDTHGTVK
ncbi:hypothetical protein FQA39_LY19156 [Lamprigera yunnana]|nr:hypothetical protein FQA39_LY19156 [Lamprigera yunnana]